ncbi:MAG: hypothetical protein SGPRY_007147 [Prymnesium sp.]
MPSPPRGEAPSEARVRELVGRVPGARLLREGDKLEGQEEWEQLEAEWMRGEFDPCGDGVVSGLRVARGEGRTAEIGSGPQPEELDDVRITLRGSPAREGNESFFTMRAREHELLSREESSWVVQLSNERLSDHWAKSLRAMSRGDWCRFTCAAKKSQQWLQVLRMILAPPIANKVCVELRLDGWSEVKDVSRKKDKSLLKRLLEPPHEVETGDPSKDLERHLVQAGEARSEDAEAIGDKEGPRKRRPTPPDRVLVRYELRRLDTTEGGEVVRSAGISRMQSVGPAAWFTLGERAAFSFKASDAWLPMREVFGFQESEAAAGVRLETYPQTETIPSPSAKLNTDLASGDLARTTRQIARVHGSYQLACVVAQPPRSQDPPRVQCQVTILAAIADVDEQPSKAAPKGSIRFEFSLFDGDGPWSALHGEPPPSA